MATPIELTALAICGHTQVFAPTTPKEYVQRRSQALKTDVCDGCYFDGLRKERIAEEEEEEG